jgi:hypothetical protein
MSNTEAVRIRQEPRSRRESDAGGAACCGRSSASIQNWQRSVFAPWCAGPQKGGPKIRRGMPTVGCPRCSEKKGFESRRSPRRPQSPECRSADDLTGVSRADQRAQRSTPPNLQSCRSLPSPPTGTPSTTVNQQPAPRSCVKPGGGTVLDITLIAFRFIMVCPFSSDVGGFPSRPPMRAAVKNQARRSG